MPERPRDDEREERIQMEIVVDAYGLEEQAIGWYTYLDDALQFPFLARCVAERATSPLQIGDVVEVVGMPPEEVCEHEMFVLTPWERRTLAVPRPAWPSAYGSLRFVGPACGVAEYGKTWW